MTKPRSPGPPTVLSGATLPHPLRDLARPPDEAFLWGRLPPGPRVGLVGARWPSRRGFEIAFHAARRLAELGVTIVSGGALGIDRAAHLGALRARGATLVVAPVWNNARAYPEKNHRLFDEVLQRGGGYLTVAKSADGPWSKTFHLRNEILVALCDVLLLGEMGVPSGGLNAAKHARRSGCPRLVLPWDPGALDTRGTSVELERGVPAYFHHTQLIRLLEGRVFDNPVYWERSRDAIAAHEAALEAKALLRKGRKGSSKKVRVGTTSSVRRAKAGPSTHHDDPVLSAIARGITTIDALVDDTGLAAAVVQHRVLLLTLEGAVVRDSGGLLRAVD